MTVWDDASRVLSKERCLQIAARARSMASGGGESWVELGSWWSGAIRWGRNRTLDASDRRSVAVRVSRSRHGASAFVETNQADDASLRAAVLTAERMLQYRPTAPVEAIPVSVGAPYTTPRIWSRATIDLDGAGRGGAAQRITDDAAAAGMLAAGFLEVREVSRAIVAPTGDVLYAQLSQSQFASTVRHPRGLGSGWAGASSYDWTAINVGAIARRAVDKCVRSVNPVAIEPGRYVAILEPQAVAQMTKPIVQQLARTQAEFGIGPYAGSSLGTTKLGEPLLDGRLTLSHDPMDPLLGVIPFESWGEPYRATTWFDRGRLRTLSYGRQYAMSQLNDPFGYPNSGAFRLTGGTASVDDMIASTERGLLVTRFSELTVVDLDRLLLAGFTRDGLWLISNGVVQMPVKNFRIVESPLFILNNIEQLGVPEPVFSPGVPVVVPAMKVRDFNFAALADAV